MGYLWRAAGSVITAARVVSLPVPAVVGTAMSSGVRFKTRNRPRMRCTLWRGLTTRAPMTFAQSITEPPPTAMMACAWAVRYSARPSSMLAMVGFGTVLS